MSPASTRDRLARTALSFLAEPADPVLGALLERCGPAEIVVVNRSPERAARLVARFARHLPGLTLHAVGTAVGAFALVVDATPGTPAQPAFDSGGWAFDLKYGRMPTPLLAYAQAAGASTVDGLPMLVAQALATYEIWFRDGRPFPRDESPRLMDGLLTHLGEMR